MIVAVKIDRTIDLSLFSRFLMQSGIWHSISESGDQQVIWVRTEEAKEEVVKLYDRYANGEFSLERGPSRVSQKRPGEFRQNLLRAPLVLVLIIINVICFPITLGSATGEFSEWFRLMTFTDIQLVGDKLYLTNLEHTISSGEYWRLLTPMFLHFGWIHITFNLLWVWEIGRRIEWVNGWSVLLLLVLVSSLGANVTQYLFSGASLFGGMSGVVYGLLGFSLVWGRMVPPRDHGLPKGIYIFMLVFLIVGFTGMFDLLGFGSLANGAHLGGLLAGLLVGACASLLARF